MKDYSYGIIPITKKDSEIYFLLICHNVGHWSFPKGHKIGDESDIETATRELREETGIEKCKILEGREFFEKYSRARENIVINRTIKFFVGIVDQQEVVILRSEIQSYKWANYEEAMDLISYPETKGLLKEAYASLK